MKSLPLALLQLFAFSFAVNAAPVIVESFDYEAGSVSGNDGGTGFSGSWQATRNNPSVSVPGLTWGNELEVAGNYARGAAWSGLIRPIGDTLSSAGLMENGATIWFSVIMDLEGQNTTNADLNLALGTDQFVSNVFSDRENLAAGEGIGVTHSGGTVQGVYWQDTDNDTVAERTENGSSAVINGRNGNPTRGFIVGKIEWGLDDMAFEKLTLYAPDMMLDQGEPVMAAWNVPALDQSAFNVIALQFKDQSQFDEIRFGATYEDVTTQSGVSGPVFNITEVSRDGGGSVSLTFESIFERIYRIQASTDLQVWEDVSHLGGVVIGGAGETTDFTDPNPPAGGKAYYRVIDTGEQD